MSLQRDSGAHVQSHHEAQRQRMLEEGRKLAERTLLELAHRKHMRMQKRSVLDIERVLPIVSVDKLPPRSAQEAYDIVRQPTTIRVLSEQRAFAIRDRAARIAAGLVAPDAVHEEDCASDDDDKNKDDDADVKERDEVGGGSDGVGGGGGGGPDKTPDGADEDERRKRQAEAEREEERKREEKRKRRDRELRVEAEYRRRDLLRDNTQRRLARAAALRRRRVPKIIGEAHPAWPVLWRHVHVERRNLYLDGVSTCGKTDLALELFRLLQTAAAQNFATRRRDGSDAAASSSASLPGTLTLLNSSAPAPASSSSASSPFSGAAVAVVSAVAAAAAGTAPSANARGPKRPSAQQLTRDAHRTVAFVTGASYVAADFLRALAVQRRVASEQRHEIRQRQVYDAVGISTRRARANDAALCGAKRNAPGSELERRQPTLRKRPRLAAARSRDGHDPVSQPERDAADADEEQQNREAEQWWLGERTRAASQPARGSERWWRQRQRQQTRPGDQRRKRKALLDTHLFASWTSLLANVTPGQFSAAAAVPSTAAPSASEQKESGGGHGGHGGGGTVVAASSESARADYARKYLEEQRLQTVQRLTLELMIARPGARPFFAARVWVVDDLHLVPRAEFVALDVVARVARGRPDLPFGGIQMVALGDLRRARGRVVPRAPPLLPPRADRSDASVDDPERLFELPQWTHLFPTGCAHRLEGDDLLAELHRVDDTTLMFVAECVKPVDRSVAPPSSSSSVAAVAAPVRSSPQSSSSSSSVPFPTTSSSAMLSPTPRASPPLVPPDVSSVATHTPTSDASRPVEPSAADGDHDPRRGGGDRDRDRDVDTDRPRASTYEQEALERERALERLVTIVVTETDAEATLYNDEANLALVCRHRQQSGADRSRQLLVVFEAADEREAIAARRQRTQQREAERDDDDDDDKRRSDAKSDGADQTADERKGERHAEHAATETDRKGKREWENSELYDDDDDDGDKDEDDATEPGGANSDRARKKSETRGTEDDGDGDDPGNNLDPDEIRQRNERERRERLARWSCENLVRARGGAAEFEVVTLAFDAIVQLTRSVVRHGKVYYAGALGRVFWRRDDTPYVKFTGYRRPIRLKPLPAVADVSGAPPPLTPPPRNGVGTGTGVGNIRAERKYQLPLRRAAALSVAQLAGLPVRKPWRLDTSRLTNARSLYDALSRVKESRRGEFTLDRLRERLAALVPLDATTGAYCDSLPAYLFPELAAPQTLSRALVASSSAASSSSSGHGFGGGGGPPSLSSSPPLLTSPPASPLSLTSLLASPLAVTAPSLPTAPTRSAISSMPPPLASPPRSSSLFSPSLFFASSSSSASASPPPSLSAFQNFSAPLRAAAPSPSPPLLRTTSLGPLPSASRTGSVRISSFSQ